MNTLFLRLEGPLQAWGLRARWGERDTADAPTKSGVVGLLGCALGLRRDDSERRALSDALRLGVRVDLPGTRLRDYHTTGGGRFGETVHRGGSRFHSDPYAGGVLSAEVDAKGRIKVKINAGTKEPETDVSERHYLADASFLAALQGPPDLIASLAAAVQNPVWPCFLGRKACVPATPLFEGVGQHEEGDLLEALAARPFSPRVLEAWLPPQGRPAALRYLVEAGPGEGIRQYDNLAAPARRVFRPRYVREEWRPLDGGPAPLNTLEG
ncbi:MAG TPA: type I-E CRISPR-associated protein Cas5/CasD [Chloroflexaceae bacterium]|mgnify:CR=1 FL=1|nr:type I-E CRISPR-associated protein Cas5/CasD [Chloroflexaceae bacterium]